MIKECDFKWHIKYENNIETNPIESEYCILDTGRGIGRMYHIQPMRKADCTCLKKMEDPFKYFIFFEGTVEKLNSAHDFCCLYESYQKIHIFTIFCG